MRYPYTDQQLIRQRDYWRGKAQERRQQLNRKVRELNEAHMARQAAEDRLQSYLGTPASRALDAKDREIARLFKLLNETEQLAEEREEDLSARLQRSKAVGDHLSKMLREARQRERDAEERADHLRDKLAQSTTRNVEQGRQIETLSASVGDSDRVDASMYATDASDISEAITRYIDQAIEMHVVDEHIDD